MKKIFTIVAALLMNASVWAQAPEKMSYQAVVRDAGDALVTTQAVGMQISILQTTATGTAVYVETQTPTSNANGLVSLEIGSGTVVSGTFNTIDWSAGPYFIKTETDPTGGTTYTITGTSQLMSVPYALHANTAENVTNDLVDDADADPTNEMNTGVVLNGTDLEITDGNGTIVTDLSSLQDGTGTDNQTLTISQTGDTLTINGGNSVLVPGISLLNFPQPASVGDLRDGGIVFWVDPTDNTKGLVAALVDQSVSAEWGCAGTGITGADGISIGTGAQNTIDIEAGCTTVGTAADICANLLLNGFNDWFLPSKDELNLMYDNIGQGDALGLGNVGGFVSIYYWSSTEVGLLDAWLQNFANGSQLGSSKNYTTYVRAVRAF